MSPNTPPWGRSLQWWSLHLHLGNQKFQFHQLTRHPKPASRRQEGSLEDIPTNISPITAVYSSGSVSPLVDPLELQVNANRAINNMLHLKRSPDIKRQRATWELGVLLHQNKSQEAASVTVAKAVYSQSVLEAKTTF